MWHNELIVIDIFFKQESWVHLLSAHTLLKKLLQQASEKIHRNRRWPHRVFTQLQCELNVISETLQVWFPDYQVPLESMTADWNGCLCEGNRCDNRIVAIEMAVTFLRYYDQYYKVYQNLAWSELSFCIWNLFRLYITFWIYFILLPVFNIIWFYIYIFRYVHPVT